ncbi:Phosphatidylinositol 4-kinase alpha 1 [Camellia lanceoleosa]|uniref:Phosphatidylinositol 4-kinase alpha 1 n=1 Tax=Camellia lanceoleosa TaxID=1840588 RepID=A0ACC0F914_9ERIC|nr:Phosphatidylinositol 4-kinase alpha 1 [Camellia lanceoleosa]
MLCQHEADRLEVWAQPVNSKENTSEKWIEYARIAFSVDPQIALSLASRFPTNTFLKAKMTPAGSGMMGSGKTTVGKVLFEALAYSFVDRHTALAYSIARETAGPLLYLSESFTLNQA